MNKKSIGLLVICTIIAFVLGTRLDINKETSPVNTSDVIAVVNNDQKQKYLGGDLKFGDNFLNQVSKMDTKYEYSLTASSEAAQGLVSGKYAGVIEIPSNFTKAILSINMNNPERTAITYTISNDVSYKKRNQIEIEINTIINAFKDNVSYMFIYSIFEQLHITQEGISVLGENAQPVYVFLTELGEIDIVGNHQYELEPNNSDSFEQIDISEQLKQFSMTVEKYKTEVEQIITVFDAKNTNYTTLLKLVTQDLVINDEQLNQRIENIEDTLQSLVNDNLQYTDENYSNTNVKPNMKRLIIDYLNQLQMVNNTDKTDEKFAKQLTRLDESAKYLNENVQYNGILYWLSSRIEYYSQLKNIDETCLQKPTNDQAVVGDCYEDYRNNYNGAYTSYQSVLEQLEKEQDYYSSMTYYLEHMAALSSESSSASSPVDISVPINQTDIEVDTQKDNEQVEISLTDYSQLSTTNNYIELTVKNTADLKQLEIPVTDISNVDQVELVSANTQVETTEDSISFETLNRSDIQVIYNVTKKNEHKPITISLNYDNQNYQLKTKDKAALTFDTKHVDNNSQLSFDSQYTVEKTGSEIEVSLCSADSQCDLTAIKLTSEDDAVEITDSGVSIDTSAKQVGDIIEFNLMIPNQYTSQINRQSIEVNDVPYQTLIITEQTNVESKARISDDPYQFDSTDEDKYATNEDDIDENDGLEPAELIGLNYTLTTTGQTQQQLSQVSFEYDIPNNIIDTLPTEVYVVVDNEAVSATTTFAVNLVTIDFNSPVTIGNLTEEGTYQSEINIYLNLQLNSNIQQSEVELNLENPSLVLDEKLLHTTESVNKSIKFTVGAPNLDSVVYEVEGESCTSNEISSCQFEAGEEVTRKISISNMSDDVAGGLTISNILSEGSTSRETVDPFEVDSIEIVMSDGEVLDSSVIATYENNIKTAIEGGQQFSMPAHVESLEIISKVTFEQYATEEIALLDELIVSQYGSEKASSSAEINIMPIKLKMSIVDTTQMVEDQIITAGESIDFTIELKNTSARATSSDNNVALEIDPAGQVVSDVKLLAVEDGDWNEVNPNLITTTGSSINIDTDLAPNESIRIKVRVNFNDLTSVTSPTVNIKFQSYRDEYEEIDDEACQSEITCDSITLGLSTADYLTLARNQANEGDVLGSTNYNESLLWSFDIDTQVTIFEDVFGKLRDEFATFKNNIANLKLFTNRNNKELQAMIDQINEFGLGFESEDDTQPTADYDYCANNQEVSCQLFKLYNKIYNKELDAKEYFANLLQIIDPDNEENLGTKEDGENPINIGADFNGYGDCTLINEPTEEEECVRKEPGINKRIEAQAAKLQNVENAVDLILDNELTDVNEEPYKQQLDQINQSTNTEISQVENTNNEIFTKKVDVYNENYERIMKYVEEISEDQTYADAIDKFKGEEDIRQSESKVIVDYIYTLMPNTYLNGIPNKLVYSALVSPFNIIEQAESNSISNIVTSFNYTLFLIFIIGLGILTIILLMIYLYVNRGA